MSKQEDFELFVNQNHSNLKMAFTLGNFEDALKVVFDAGYHRGWQEGMNDAQLIVKKTYGDEE